MPIERRKQRKTSVVTSANGTKSIVYDGEPIIANTPAVPRYRYRGMSLYDDNGNVLTHTRASVATVIDYKERMHECPSGELRILRARRVHNVLTDSEGLTTGWALGANVTMTSEPAAVGILSKRRSVKKLVRTSGSGVVLEFGSRTYRPGQWSFSIALSSTNGTDQVVMRMQRSSDSVNLATVTVTPPAFPAFKRYVVTGVIEARVNYRLQVDAASAGAATFYADSAQMEPYEVSEYIATGLAGAAYPFQGWGVDGVAYFETENPCTVSSNIVTQNPNPARIDPNIIKGVLVEGTVTNTFYSSADIGSAQWTLTGATAASAQISSTLLGPIGLRKLEEDNSTGSHRVVQQYRASLPGDNTMLGVSGYVKPAERTMFYAWILGKDNVERAAWFTSSGQVLSSSGDSSIELVVWPEGDCLRFSMTTKCGAGGTTPYGGIGLATTDGLKGYTGTTGSGAYIGAMQFDTRGIVMSYTGDTPSGATMTRNSDDLRIPFGFLPPGAFSFPFNVQCKYTPVHYSGTKNKLQWVYAWYGHSNSINRFGLSLRPGAYGGSQDNQAAAWALDLYPNSSQWDGINIITGAPVPPLHTAQTKCSFASYALVGNSNQALVIDGVVGTNSAAAVQGVNPIPPVTSIGLGMSSDGTDGKAAAAIKDFEIWSGV